MARFLPEDLDKDIMYIKVTEPDDVEKKGDNFKYINVLYGINNNPHFKYTTIVGPRPSFRKFKGNNIINY